MHFSDRDETVLYHLLAYYSNESLTHGAWLASFSLAVSTFVVLKLTSGLQEVRGFGLVDVIILFLLLFAVIYTLGRLFFFSKLVSEVTNIRIIEPFEFPPLYVAHQRVVGNIESTYKSHGPTYWFHISFWFWFACQFRESFAPRTFLYSATFALLLMALGTIASLAISLLTQVFK